MELWLSYSNACGLCRTSLHVHRVHHMFFQSLHSIFKVSFKTLLLEMWNMNFQWSSLLSFFCSLIHVTGFKCSPESCPGGLMTPDRHSFQSSVWHLVWQPRQGAHCLRHWINCGSSGRKGGAGLTQPISRDQLTHAPSLQSEENKRIYKVNWAAVTEVKLLCLVTALVNWQSPYAKSLHPFWNNNFVKNDPKYC